MNLDDFDLATILTKVIAAAVIILITAVLAKLVKSLLGKLLARVGMLQRQGQGGDSLADSLATLASLVVWLFGLMAVLNLFDLTTVVAPIQQLLDGLLGALPGVIGAALLLLVGYIVAKVVRDLVTTALSAAGADRLLERAAGGESGGDGDTAAAAGTTTTTTTSSSSPSLSAIAGQLVFALVLIVFAIAALQVLGIEAISGPATEMLTLILGAVPSILAAAILLGIGYVIGRFVAPLLESMLRGLGVDRALDEIGVSTGTTSASRVIARIVHVAIVLFFAIAATRVLGFPEVTAILDAVLEIAGRIVFGGAVIAVGVLIANVLSRLASGRAADVVKWGTIALFVAMGLQFMGVADIIVTLAFGSIVVGTALAAAIAFGLGGRDAAARQLERMQQSRGQDTPTTPSDPLAGP